jgi:hypothetical protein
MRTATATRRLVNDVNGLPSGLGEPVESNTSAIGILESILFGSPSVRANVLSGEAGVGQTKGRKATLERGCA